MIKHSSKACLFCRERHLKCNGENPCQRCGPHGNGKECVYIKSRRGGTRPPRKDRTNSPNIGLHEQMAPFQTFYNPNKFNGGYVNYESNLNLHQTNAPVYYGMSNSKPQAFFPSPPSLPSGPSTDTYDGNNDFQGRDPVIFGEHYKRFNKVHAFLFTLEDINKYNINVESFGELYKVLQLLLLVMGPNINTDHELRLQTITTTIDELEPILASSVNDIPTLQAYILITLIAHLSGLHSRAEKFRVIAVKLCISLNLSVLDSPAVSLGANSGVSFNYISTRGEAYPISLWKEYARRSFWELIFVDTTLSAIVNKKSILGDIDYRVNIPLIPALSRIPCYALRNQALSLFHSVITFGESGGGAIPEDFEKFYDSFLTRYANLKIKLQDLNTGALNDPDTRYYPGLVDQYGRLNENIHQTWMVSYIAMIMITYPNSALITLLMPRKPSCMNNSVGDTVETSNDPNGSSNVIDNPNSSDEDAFRNKSNPRSIIRSHQAVEAAKGITGLISHITSLSSLEQRSPLFICSIAISTFIHISALINILADSERSANPNETDSNILNELEDSLELNINSLRLMGKTWLLAGRIHGQFIGIIEKVFPSLYRRKFEVREIPVVSPSLYNSSEASDGHQPRTPFIMDNNENMGNFEQKFYSMKTPSSEDEFNMEAFNDLDMNFFSFLDGTS